MTNLTQENENFGRILEKGKNNNESQYESIEGIALNDIFLSRN
jgi:hypothetical protein